MKERLRYNPETREIDGLTGSSKSILNTHARILFGVLRNELVDYEVSLITDTKEEDLLVIVKKPDGSEANYKIDIRHITTMSLSTRTYATLLAAEIKEKFENHGKQRKTNVSL